MKKQGNNSRRFYENIKQYSGQAAFGKYLHKQSRRNTQISNTDEKAKSSK